MLLLLDTDLAINGMCSFTEARGPYAIDQNIFQNQPAQGSPERGYPQRLKLFHMEAPIGKDM